MRDSLDDGIQEAMDNYLEKESTRNAIDSIQSKVRRLKVCWYKCVTSVCVIVIVCVCVCVCVCLCVRA